MGTCYRIVDHKNKLYYEMDKWCVTEESLASAQALETFLVDGYDEDAWQIDMARAVVRDVSKYMEFPLTYVYDTGDEWDQEKQGYRMCGDRFCSYLTFYVPYGPLPIEAGEYLVWDTDPTSASRPKPELVYWNGRQWCDKQHRPLVVHKPFWWAYTTNQYAMERL